MKLKLIYPDIPFWRAETSRIALFLGDVEFEDFRPSRDQLKQMKTDGTFPFGQFPVLEVDGKKVAQTSGIARLPDPEQRKLKREELSREILPRWLGFLENLLEENGNTGFFVGDSLTVADLAAWRLCGWIRGGIIDGIPQTQLDAHPRLLEHHLRIGEIPKIDEWMKKHYAS